MLSWRYKCEGVHVDESWVLVTEDKDWQGEPSGSWTHCHGKTGQGGAVNAFCFGTGDEKGTIRGPGASCGGFYCGHRSENEEEEQTQVPPDGAWTGRSRHYVWCGFRWWCRSCRARGIWGFSGLDSLEGPRKGPFFDNGSCSCEKRGGQLCGKGLSPKGGGVLSGAKGKGKKRGGKDSGKQSGKASQAPTDEADFDRIMKEWRLRTNQKPETVPAQAHEKPEWHDKNEVFLVQGGEEILGQASSMRMCGHPSGTVLLFMHIQSHSTIVRSWGASNSSVRKHVAGIVKGQHRLRQCWVIHLGDEAAPRPRRSLACGSSVVPQ